MSLFRNVTWYLKGLKEYTHDGFLKASKHFNSHDLEVDVTRRVFMVTGANSGLGKFTAKALAQRGGTVHLVCRNRDRADEVKQEITRETGNEKLHVHIVDMSDLRQVHRFVREFVSSGQPLDVLINNAGAMMTERETVDGGIEKSFATNTLGGHILTKGLMPVLLKAEKARVIIVSSGGMLVQKLDPHDLNHERMTPYDGTMVYAQHKRQQVVLAESYARQEPSIFVASMHPGWADTAGVRQAMPGFYEKLQGKWRSESEGADTILWLAVSDAALQHPSGSFFQDRKPVSKHLPLAWSKSSSSDESLFIQKVAELCLAASCI